MIVYLAILILFVFGEFALLHQILKLSTRKGNEIELPSFKNRVHFVLCLSPLTLFYALWWSVILTVKIDSNADSYSIGIGLSLMSIPGVILAALTAIPVAVLLNTKTRRIPFVFLMIVGICFAWGDYIGRHFIAWH